MDLSASSAALAIETHDPQVAKIVIDSIRFRLNLDKDGQYRFGAVHFAAPQVQSEYGSSVENLMVGHTVREILISLRQKPQLPRSVAGALQDLLQNLQPVIA